MNVMNKIFDAFLQDEVDYVHFKSNMHLDRSFLGKADFDILINRLDHNRVMRILMSNSGKLVRGPAEKYYPGVEDWLIFDDESGVIHHLHLHCQLASGKPCLKDYVIPWSEICLQTKVLNQDFSIFTTSPEVELLLLTVRIVLKSRVRDSAKARFGLFSLNNAMEEERQDLLSKVDKSELHRLSEKLFAEGACDAVLDIACRKNITGKDFRKLSGIVRKTFKINRYYSPFISCLKSFSRYNSYRIKLHMRARGRCIISKKVSTSGGLIIAFVGVDGSGKSTTTKEIVKWLTPQIECKRFYMGEGEENPNLFVSVFKRAVSLSRNNVQRGLSNAEINSNSHHKASLFKRVKQRILIRILLMIEKGNRKNIKKMCRYRQRGGISVLDRYPQLEVSGCNDGPKVSTYEKYFGTKNSFLRRMGKKEIRLIEVVKTVKPSLMFRLNISVDTSMARKPEQRDRKVFDDKLSCLNGITFQGANIVDIDAEQPYDEELLEIKKIIWGYF